jgi:hypothetical protein
MDWGTSVWDEHPIGMAPELWPEGDVALEERITEAQEDVSSEAASTPPPVAAALQSDEVLEKEARESALSSFISDLGVGEFWATDARWGPALRQPDSEDWAYTRSLTYLKLDNLTWVRFYASALQMLNPSARDVLECALYGGWVFRFHYHEEDLPVFAARRSLQNPLPSWMEDRVRPYGYLDKRLRGGTAAINSRYLVYMKDLLVRRPHLCLAVQDGHILSAVYQFYAPSSWITHVLAGPTDDLLYYGNRLRETGLYAPCVHERLNQEESKLLLGYVYDAKQPSYEASLWPPVDVWIKSGHYSSRALHRNDHAFILRRAQQISDGYGEPMTRAQWRSVLRLDPERRKEASIVDGAYRNAENALRNLLRGQGWEPFLGLWDLDHFTSSRKPDPEESDGMNETSPDGEGIECAVQSGGAM